MKALISTASKHGSTAEIGDVIGEVLREHGIEIDVLGPEAVTSLEGYDLTVLGSAVYAGHWMKSMRELAERLAEDLAARPVWLFSSGPIGDPPKPDEDPVDVAEVMERTGARGHAVFAGKIERSRLGFGERAIVSALKVPEGDFRDWDEIRRWAAGIVEELRLSV
ncbi:MAG TPA: flavodoxin domain-containing protein [Acidimicrobiia bacterium]|nr:flavodoxin domain-containing protein [Acidimicrobiia bacterium]